MEQVSSIGVFDDLRFGSEALATFPSSLAESDHYREDNLTATINQLVGQNWSLGGRYRYTQSKLHQQLPAFREALKVVTDPTRLNNLASGADNDREASLHELSLFVLYNHPSGWFARFDANWYSQANDTFVTAVPASDSVAPEGVTPALRTTNVGPPGDDFWQFNLVAGYRFYRNQCELSCGLLNIAGQDYQLNPLNPYYELARDRTVIVRCKLNF